jgi:hypothetical protein
MRFRTLALALALTFGVGSIGEAKTPAEQARARSRKQAKKYKKAYKPGKVKTRKVKKTKTRHAA